MNRIQKLHEYLKENPQDSFLQHALALEYIKRGDDRKALELFQNILINEPEYVGSYYHLAKLFERIGKIKEALKTFEQGMEQARKAGDNHTYNELKSAYEEVNSL